MKGKTTNLADKIKSLLEELRSAAQADRAAGRFIWADTQIDLIESVEEYVRLHENIKKVLWGP